MRHQRWLELAIEIAKKNDNIQHKHGAVLVCSGRVLSVGWNTERRGYYPSRHAEWHAVRDHLDDKATLYVARVTKSGHIANSSPCCRCMEQLMHYTKVKEVWFTLEPGIASSFDLCNARNEMRNGYKPAIRV